MNKLSNMLKYHGIKKGDRVAIYMPTGLMAVAAMLACVRIGAIHAVVFAGFSAESLASRINDCKLIFKNNFKFFINELKLIKAECVAVITTKKSQRGGKIIELKKTVDTAVKSCPSIKNVFVFDQMNSNEKPNSIDVPVNTILDQFSSECEPEIMDADDPLCKYLKKLYLRAF